LILDSITREKNKTEIEKELVTIEKKLEEEKEKRKKVTYI
jgi:hypothetical protein